MKSTPKRLAEEVVDRMEAAGDIDERGLLRDRILDCSYDPVTKRITATIEVPWHVAQRMIEAGYGCLLKASVEAVPATPESSPPTAGPTERDR